MELQEQIKELKTKLFGQEPSDFTENSFREFITEFSIKRDQVNQQKIDLDLLKRENKVMKNELEVANKTIEDLKFNLAVFKRKAHIFDTELAEARGTIWQMKMKRQMSAAEVDNLKESLQKAELERIELTKKVELYESKQKCYSTYTNDFFKREKKIKTFIDETNRTMNFLKAETHRVKDLLRNVDFAKKALNDLEEARKKVAILSLENSQLEENYVKTLAKVEKFEELVTRYGGPDKYDLANIVLAQWRANQAHKRQQVQQSNERSKQLASSLENESTSNQQLLCKLREVVKQKEQLMEELKCLKISSEETTRQLSEKNVGVQEEQEIIQIKDEPIHVLD